MQLYPSQYIGHYCRYGPYVTGQGILYASGEFSGYGVFQGEGTYCGYGHYDGYGTFVMSSGEVSGYAPGFAPKNDLDTDAGDEPLITVFGVGRYYGEHVFSDNSTEIEEDQFPTFYIRNRFIVTGTATGDIINTVGYTGFGYFCGSGLFNANGYVKANGILDGSGNLTGDGLIYQYVPPVGLEACYGVDSQFLASGRFTVRGVISGSGVYESISDENSYTQSGTREFISGRGDYRIIGSFKGYSARAFYGFGYCTGQNVTYKNLTGFSWGVPDEFYGIGDYEIFSREEDDYVESYLVGYNGYYVGQGTGRGSGLFYVDGNFRGLNFMNRMSGFAESYYGTGTVYDVNPNTWEITGILCEPSIPTGRSEGCRPFPKFITSCSLPSQIPFNFNYLGDCI